MNDEEMEDTESGLGVLRSSLSSAIRGGGPLSDVISRSLERAGVPESIEVDYEPMPAEERRAPSTSPFRDRFIAELEQTTQKLLAPKPEPKTIIGKLAREFAIPTGKSGNLFVAQRERAEKEAEDEMTRRKTILEILGKQTELERQKALDEAEEKRKLAEAMAKGSKTSLQGGGGRRYVFRDPAAAGVKLGRISAVFDPEMGPGYLNDRGEFVPENLAPPGTRIITSSIENPAGLAIFDKRQVALEEEKIGLDKLQSFFKNVSSLDRGYKNVANKFIADIKNFLGRPINGKQFSTLEAEAQQQALLGAIKDEVLGGGVLTEQDAERLISSLGGSIFSGKLNPDLVAARIKEIYSAKYRRASVQSNILKRDAELYNLDPEQFSITAPSTLGGDTLREGKPRDRKPPPSGGARTPPTGGATTAPAATKVIRGKTWVLKKDAKGNMAYVSPDGKEFEEVR